MFVGIADTFTVSFASEAEVSGVSLVSSFNTVLFFLFTALSSGGAVIISQYIGSRRNDLASRASGQLLMLSSLLSAVLTALILLFQTPLLKLLFGRIETDVMTACRTYLFITTLSLPFLAVYDAGAALCRSIGKTNVTTYISIAANVINVAGNCIGVFLLHMGAAGVAYPSLLSRILSAIAVTAYCFRRGNPVHYKLSDIFCQDGALLKKIIHIALPNGVENGVHQLVKVALSSMVALFGTYQIAANGVAQSIWSLAAIMGLAMAPVYTTVIGQCMGGKRYRRSQLLFSKAQQNHTAAVHPVECTDLCPHTTYCALFGHFPGSERAGALAGPHQ